MNEYVRSLASLAVFTWIAFIILFVFSIISLHYGNILQGVALLIFSLCVYMVLCVVGWRIYEIEKYPPANEEYQL